MGWDFFSILSIWYYFSNSIVITQDIYFLKIKKKSFQSSNTESIHHVTNALADSHRIIELHHFHALFSLSFAF